MSEEILKALTQLFAIISKQDGGVSDTERSFVIGFFQQELDLATVAEYVKLYDEYAGYGIEAKVIEDEEKLKNKKTAINVKDSVRTLSLCRKINKTLNQRQKVIVLTKLLEMLASDNDFTPSKMEIISTVSDVFNILPEEYQLLERFAKENDIKNLDSEDFLIFDEEQLPATSKAKWIDSGYLDGEIIFLRLKSVGLYFTKYNGEDEIFLNGKIVRKGTLLQFAPGSVFKTPKGEPLYYSDLVSKFNSDKATHNISFNVENLEFKFPNGVIGLRNINLYESSGNLIGIMGASGAGKTTLLNVLAGLETPSAGTVKINGFNIHQQKDKIEGVIGYIAQDDLLIEELTVYQNLYYNAKLCFKSLNEEEIDLKVRNVLTVLGLDRIADLVVGNVLNKKISGGQRKRLNIALELIREPAVLFVDEPTSGLSSRDSENVIDLLKELSLKGKLIFVVIHQPSSDIYKMFDKMWILDTGGYPIFYGNPIEAVVYFKTASQQVGSDRGQCPTCGNVNPEQVFNIVEARVVDEYGEFTNKRKVNPTDWHNLYRQKVRIERKPDITDIPPKALDIPSKLKQMWIFIVRDFLSKISNTQYMLINLLQAPFLAILLSWIIRYRMDADADYIYRHNDNIPAYILICVIISLFMGLTVSAEEIIRDRKIQKRETFLNLSRTSYLLSKLTILFTLSAIQTLSFVLIGNAILDIEGLDLMYWLVLFAVSCHANVLGLNISSAFNSAVTVYILIPLLLIPQMILSGLIFDYDRLNSAVSEPGRVPLLADFMVSRWAYEAIAVEQYRNNEYNKYIFDVELKESTYNFKITYWQPKIEELLINMQNSMENLNDSTKAIIAQNAQVLSYELKKEPYFSKKRKDLNIDELLSTDKISPENVTKLYESLEGFHEYYTVLFNKSTEKKDAILASMQQKLAVNGSDLAKFKDQYFNEQLADLVKNGDAEDRILLHDGKLIQITDPIFEVPSGYDRFPLDYRVQFFAPKKPFMNRLYPTIQFNLFAILFMTSMLYVALYFDLLSKVIIGIGNISKRLEEIFKKVKTKIDTQKLKQIIPIPAKKNQ